MDEIKANIDVSVRLNTSKNNIQINSKTQGTQSINFQEILINVGETTQKTVSSNANQSIVIESLQSQASEKELSQNNDNSNINNDKNASTSMKSSSASQGQTALFSEYIPQKPVDVQDLNLDKKPQDKKELIPLKKNKRDQLNTKREKTKINLSGIKIIEIRERKQGLGQTENDDKENKSLQINKKDNQIVSQNKKEENFEDKEDQKKKNHYYPEEDEVTDNDIKKILESYGIDSPEFIGSGNNDNDDQWIKNMIFGAIKENITSSDADKMSKFLVNKNPEFLADKDKIVFTKLVNEIFKHKIINLEPEMLSRFEKQSTEFIIKNFPHIIYSGTLKKYFDSDDKKIKESKIKVFIASLNNEKVEQDDLKDALNYQDEELENINGIINGDYLELTHESLYNGLNKLKQSGLSFGSFTDNIHQLIVDFYETKAKEKLKQIVKIASEYRKYNFISENDSHSLSSMIVKKYFDSEKLAQNKLTEIMTKLIQGENIEPLYLNLINQSLNKNILSYLPNTINHQVYQYLKEVPFYENECISDSQNDQDLFKFFIKVKINNSIPNNINIKLLNIDQSEDIEINLNKENIDLNNLINGSYKLKAIIRDGHEINFAEYDKNFSLDFSIDKKTDIFYFGTLEIKLNDHKNTFSFKIKNEYKSFLDIYKKKYPQLFKKASIKVNPKLFR